MDNIQAESSATTATQESAPVIKTSNPKRKHKPEALKDILAEKGLLPKRPKQTQIENEYSDTIFHQAQAIAADPVKTKALEIIYPNITRSWDDPQAIKIAHILNKAIEVYFTKNGDLLPFEVRKKSVGINSGFIISGPNNSQPKFIKTFLDPEVSAKPSSIELLTYWLLQESGFGATVEAHTCCDGEIAFLASHDIQERGKVFIGIDAIKLAQDVRDNQQFKERIIALEILAKILNLGDVKTNLGNFGIVVDADGKLNPVILDFHFNPQPADFPLSASATKITFQKMEARFGEDCSTPCATVGLTRTFKQTGLTQEVYTNAIKRLPLDMVNAAIESGAKYCNHFYLQIKNPKLASQFNPDTLESYCDLVMRHYQKLNNFEEFKHEPINVMNHVLPQGLMAKSSKSANSPAASPKFVAQSNISAENSPAAWKGCTFFT